MIPILSAYNPTQFARREYCIFGTREPTPWTYSGRMGGCLNVARFSVPPFHDGPIVPDDDNPGTEPVFSYHPAVLNALNQFHPYLIVNGSGTKYYFAPIPAAETVVTQRMAATVWVARTPIGTAELVLYCFRNQPGVPFELTFFAERFDNPQVFVDLYFGIGLGADCYSWLFDQTKSVIEAAADPKPLYSGKLGDSQGIPFDGILHFGAGGSLLTAEERSTAAAQSIHPLAVAARWDTWGPCQKITDPALPAPPEPMAAWGDPLANCGFIGNNTPADTGEQAEFGVWMHVPTVSSGSARGLWRMHIAARREACRPGFYFEPDGTPVQARNHPDWVTLNEETHYSRVVSPDRLGRTHAGSWPTGGWRGNDRQHVAYNFTCENLLLTGSIATERLIAQRAQEWLAGETLPSEKPNWSTNDPDAGRAVGRTFQWFAYLCWVMPPRPALAIRSRGDARLRECVLPKFAAMNPPNGVIKLYEETDDPRTGFPGIPVWNVWQDAIMAGGLGVYAQVTGNTDAQAIARALAAAVVNYGYYPDVHDLVAYMVTPNRLPPVNYDDPTKVKDSSGTDFRYWALMAVGIAERTDPTLLRRCHDIEAAHAAQARDTYTGTLLP